MPAASAAREPGTGEVLATRSPAVLESLAAPVLESLVAAVLESAVAVWIARIVVVVPTVVIAAAVRFAARRNERS
jgi:hypothetical protein